METEFTEELTLVKQSSFEDKWFYIFQNANGEFRSLDSEKFRTVSLLPGNVVQARMQKKGCAGWDITELVLIKP